MRHQRSGRRSARATGDVLNTGESVFLVEALLIGQAVFQATGHTCTCAARKRKCRCFAIGVVGIRVGCPAVRCHTADRMGVVGIVGIVPGHPAGLGRGLRLRQVGRRQSPNVGEAPRLKIVEVQRAARGRDHTLRAQSHFGHGARVIVDVHAADLGETLLGCPIEPQRDRAVIGKSLVADLDRTPAVLYCPRAESVPAGVSPGAAVIEQAGADLVRADA